MTNYAILNDISRAHQDLMTIKHNKSGTTMMTSSNGNIFRVTGHLCGKFTGHWLIPRTKANDAELWCCFFICAWIYGWVNNHDAGDLSRHRVHYDVTVMQNSSPAQSYECLITREVIQYAHLAKFMGPTWGLPGPCRSWMGPMLATWILLSGELGKIDLLNTYVGGNSVHNSRNVLC